MMTNEKKGTPTGVPAFTEGANGGGLLPPHGDRPRPSEPAAPVSAVLYEDAAVLVACKPSGILSAPVEGKRETSFPDLLSPDRALFVVHRLDRPTAGVMVYAKTAAAAAFLSTKGEMEKTYLAVCEGLPEEKAAALSDLLFFDRAKDKSFVVTRPRRGVKEARLSYEVLKTLSPAPAPDFTEGGAPEIPAAPVSTVGAEPQRSRRAGDAPAPRDTAEARPPLSLLRVTLDTGRTHQIRAQFSHRRLPLVGDRRYGAKTGGSLGLFAARLSFIHPISGKRMTIEAPMPKYAPFSYFL